MAQEPRSPSSANGRQPVAEFCPYCMSRVEPGQSCPVCGLTKGAYTPSPHHLPLGTILAGRYLVGRALGEGGFGITYIGCDLRLEMKVAIKEYFPVDRVSRYATSDLSVISRVGTSSRDFELGLKRFLYEARTMARLEKQPQIVMVRDFFEANNTAYIVMEYVEGTNFIELAAQRGGRIPPSELFPLIDPLFTALSAIHAAGLIHRDISPDNLMLERGSVRLLDFGCARESAARGTETMTVALKQGYAPIEQYQRKGQGPWTDVYALSATIYFCLTGKVPPQSLDRILEDELVPPRSLGVELTEAQEKALLKGMALQPRLRYQTVEELHANLYPHVPAAATVQPARAAGTPAEEPAQPEPPVQTAAPDGEAPREPAQAGAGEPAGETPAEAPVRTAPLTNEPAAETDETSAEAGKPPRRAKRRWPWLAAGGAVALALLLALVLPRLASLQEQTDPSASPSAVAAETPEPASSTQASSTPLNKEALFAGAVEVDTSAALTSALHDESISSIICTMDIDESLTAAGFWVNIDKPVLVPAEVILGIHNSVCVREGGVLWVDGILSSIGCVYVNGGALVSGSQSEINSTIYLEREDALVPFNPAQGNIPDHLLSGAEAFADALSVTTLDQLQEALEREDGVALRIDGAIELAEDLQVDVPLLVGQEGSLSGPSSALLTLTGPLLNYGNIDVPLSLSGTEAQLFNMGELHAGNGTWLCETHNLGTIYLDEEGGQLYLDEGKFINFSKLNISSGECVLGAFSENRGIFQIDGELVQAGSFLNAGSIQVGDGGRLVNAGLLDAYDYSSAITVASSGELNTEEGVLFTRDRCKLDGAVQGKVWSVDFSSIDGPFSGELVEVASSEELRNAMQDENVETVVIVGDVHLKEDLRVEKALYVNNGRLSVDNGHSIVVSNAILCINGSLTCSDLRLENGAMMELIGAWHSLLSPASLHLSGASWLISRNSSMEIGSAVLEGESMAYLDCGLPQAVELREASVLAFNSQDVGLDFWDAQVDGGSRILQLGSLSLPDASIYVTNGSYRHFGELSLSRATIEISGGSQFCSYEAPIQLGEEVYVQNRGLWDTRSCQPVYSLLFKGRFQNMGELVLGRLELDGGLWNLGSLQNLYPDIPVTLGVKGRVLGDDSSLLLEGAGG